MNKMSLFMTKTSPSKMACDPGLDSTRDAVFWRDSVFLQGLFLATPQGRPKSEGGREKRGQRGGGSSRYKLEA